MQEVDKKISNELSDKLDGFVLKELDAIFSKYGEKAHAGRVIDVMISSFLSTMINVLNLIKSSVDDKETKQNIESFVRALPYKMASISPISNVEVAGGE
jgi:hypothetical protein